MLSFVATSAAVVRYFIVPIGAFFSYLLPDRGETQERIMLFSCSFNSPIITRVAIAAFRQTIIRTYYYLFIALVQYSAKICP